VNSVWSTFCAAGAGSAARPMPVTKPDRTVMNPMEAERITSLLFLRIIFINAHHLFLRIICK
jgi:hypothetical protein